MSQHSPSVRSYADHGALVIREGLKVCFYMRRSGHQVASAVMQPLEAFLRAIGRQTLTWYVDLEGDFQELDERGWELNRRNLLESSWPRIALIDASDCIQGFGFEYYGKDPRFIQDTEPDAVSAVCFWLPTEFLEAHGPERVRQLALELAAPLPFCSGHAGLSFNALFGLRRTHEELARLCLRYPGLDMIEVDSLSWRLGTRVKGPAWMTFLGQPVLGELGGAEGLRARLSSPDTTIQPLDGERAVITLGPWPEAGDTQAGNTLPQYRELARVLEPWLHHSQGPWPYFPEDVRQRWERRFLD